MIQFEVPGPAVAKARARVFTVKTKSGGVFHRAYTPSKTVNYENWIKLCFQEQKNDGFEPFSGPVWMQVDVFESVPSSFSQKKRKMALSGEIFPLKHPDCSNLLKSFEDALNGLAYGDDKQIVSVYVTKAYGEKPRAVVRIEGMSSVL